MDESFLLCPAWIGRRTGKKRFDWKSPRRRRRERNGREWAGATYSMSSWSESDITVTSYFDLAVTRARQVTRANPTFTATNTPSSVLQRTRTRVCNVAITHGPPEKTFYRTGVITGSEYSMRVSVSQAPLALAVSFTPPYGGPDHLQNKLYG
jgi:hypothetical protein